jgi:hypothetical protein
LFSVWNGLCACGAIEPNILMFLYYGGRLLDFFMSGLYGGGGLLIFVLLWLWHWCDELKWRFCMGYAPVWMDNILPALNVWLYQHYRLFLHLMVLMEHSKNGWNLLSPLVGPPSFGWHVKVTSAFVFHLNARHLGHASHTFLKLYFNGSERHQ